MMDKYSFYCTPEQTKEAFELGAPIKMVLLEGNQLQPIQPTAEQMIGWLEEQGLAIDVINDGSGFKWSAWVKQSSCLDFHFIDENHRCVSSRQEATLAAIDAALDYLNNKK